MCFPEFTSLHSSELGVPEKNMLSEFKKVKWTWGVHILCSWIRAVNCSTCMLVVPDLLSPLLALYPIRVGQQPGHSSYCSQRSLSTSPAPDQVCILLWRVDTCFSLQVISIIKVGGVEVMRNQCLFQSSLISLSSSL